MKTPRVRHAVAALSILLLGTALVGCSGDKYPGQTGPATSKPVPSQGSTGNPFDAEIVGPETAEPGATVTETLRNIGRLPDAYQIVIDPADAATLSESNFNLGPGESVKVKIHVRQTPFDVHLKSIGGGAPDVVALTIS